MMSRPLFLLAALGGFAATTLADTQEDFASAVAVYNACRYSDARRIFEQIAVTRPDDPEVNFHLGRLALWFDDEVSGLVFLEKAARRAPDDARIQDALGDAYGLTAQRAGIFSKYGWAKRCLAAYERAVQLDPPNVDYHWSLLNYCQQAPWIAGGGLNKSYAQAAEIQKLNPMSGRIAFATLYLAEKKYDRAFGEFDEVLRDHPDDFLALYHLGRCAALSGEQLDRGLAALRRCLLLPPPPGHGQPRYVNVHYRLGNILEKKGDAAGAKAEYAMMNQVDPDFRPAKDELKN
jgi:tetratricopeptide (TPR) repeat protein